MTFATALAITACIWSYGTDLRGQKISVDFLGGTEIVDALQAFDSPRQWQARKRFRETHPESRRDPEQLNDYAVILLHLGKVQPAIELLHNVEGASPGRYPTAANLGTAYELAGNLDEALRWIRLSIIRNPSAHDGTEWLHLRILEAKQAMAADPNWLRTHSILGLDFGDAPIPKLPAALPRGNTNKPLSNDDVKYAIWYQLDERYQFVKAPDPVVGSLLFDWGNFFFRTEALESAIALYEEALRFGAPRADLARVRLARAKQILRDHEQRRK